MIFQPVSKPVAFECFFIFILLCRIRICSNERSSVFRSNLCTLSRIRFVVKVGLGVQIRLDVLLTVNYTVKNAAKFRRRELNSKVM